VRIEDAADVFCRSFAFTRSFAFPFEFIRVGDLRIMRDARPRKQPRVQEIVVCGVDPSEALDQIAAYDPPRHFVCAMGSAPEELAAMKAVLKEGGYRMLTSEDLFVRDLSRPIDDPNPAIVRIVNRIDEDRLYRAARRHQIPIEHLDKNVVRLYAAFLDDEVAGWVRSIHLEKPATWASNLHVPVEFRRRGIGTALMNRLLIDDRLAGASHSVLLASHIGSKLYPLLGYERIGELLMFSPKR
jgi:GNAT superfamily N-acetyltransferase